MLKFFKEAHL